MVNVTKSNFLEQLEDFLQHLPSASYIALDEEMTGISLPGSRNQRPNKIELPGERYTRLLKAVPERYSILQVGVALFHKNPKYKNPCRPRSGSTSSNRSGGGHHADADDEHGYIHREGVLNQDELEDLVEREEEAADEAEGLLGDDEPASAEPEYTSRVYNFYLFPASSTREMTLSPSTIQFLLGNNMDFNKVFAEGVSYTTVDQAEAMMEKHFEKYGRKEDEKAKEASHTPSKRGGVKLSRVEDIAFCARVMAGLREWIDSDIQPGAYPNPAGAVTAGLVHENRDADEGTAVVLPPCNAFLRRALYESIQGEYPSLILERADQGQNAGPRSNQIRVMRLSPEEKERRDTRLRREAWEKILGDVGFTILFQAISDACNGKAFSKEQTESFLNGTSPDISVDGRGSNKIPLIIHNGLMDLMFLITHCHDPTLPESFEETKATIRSYFPRIVDTKILAGEYSDSIIKGGKSDLGSLFNVITSEREMSWITFKAPTISNGESSQQAHEAAYDAYMTGCVFNGLCDRILYQENGLSGSLTLDKLLHDSSDDAVRRLVGLNKLYMHVSLYTIDLESKDGPVSGVHDPLSSGLSVDTTFHVSGIDTNVSTRDILGALLIGGNGYDFAQGLRYEIIWVDDTSFFVGTRSEADITLNDASTISLLASHVRNNLHAKLGNVEILSLRNYFVQVRCMKNDSEDKNSPQHGLVGSIVSAATLPFAIVGHVLGFGKRTHDTTASEGPAHKRRRTS